MTHWDTPWALWVAGTLLSFAFIESAALIHHRPDRTLSDRLRSWLGIVPHRPWRIAGTAVFSGFLFWFLVHIVFGY